MQLEAPPASFKSPVWQHLALKLLLEKMVLKLLIKAAQFAVYASQK